MNVVVDRKMFFDKLRVGPLFSGTLKAEHVQGIEALLDTAIANNVVNPHHVSNIMAQVYHETGSYMLPIKETVYASHKDKNPSDAEVIRRLDVAFANGQLPWVKTPYWRTGWFGRGQIQITHEHNYKRLGDAIGVNLAGNRDLTLDLKVSAKIAVIGMSQGLFTGKKLSDYNFPNALNNEPKFNPRRIVNGEDGTDRKIAGYHSSFYASLMSAGYDEVGTPPVQPNRTRMHVVADIEALLEELKSFGG